MDNYQAEVINRWGDTEAYNEFKERTKNTDYNKSIKRIDTILRKFSKCKTEGNTTGSDKVQALVKELQSFITNNFYTCTDEILKKLSEMYTTDERFTNNIDKFGEGTAEFISSAIQLYCKQIKISK